MAVERTLITKISGYAENQSFAPTAVERAFIVLLFVVEHEPLKTTIFVDNGQILSRASPTPGGVRPESGDGILIDEKFPFGIMMLE